MSFTFSVPQACERSVCLAHLVRLGSRGAVSPGRENGLAAWPVSRHCSLAVGAVCCALVSCTDHSALDRMFADVHYIASVNLLSLCKEEFLRKRK